MEPFRRVKVPSAARQGVVRPTPSVRKGRAARWSAEPKAGFRAENVGQADGAPAAPNQSRHCGRETNQIMILTKSERLAGGPAEPVILPSKADSIRPSESESVAHVPDPTFDPVSSRYSEAVPNGQ